MQPPPQIVLVGSILHPHPSCQLELSARFVSRSATQITQEEEEAVKTSQTACSSVEGKELLILGGALGGVEGKCSHLGDRAPAKRERVSFLSLPTSTSFGRP